MDSPVPADVADNSPRFRWHRTGLHVIFGPNNTGKTRVLNSAANCQYGRYVSLDEFFQAPRNNSMFVAVGGPTLDIWAKIKARVPLILLVWPHSGHGTPAVHPSSQSDLLTSVASGREGIANNLGARAAEYFAVLSPAPRPAHVVKTDRFLPGVAPIQDSGPGDPYLPRDMSRFLATLAHDPDPDERQKFERIRSRFESVTSVSVAIRRAGTNSLLHVVEEGGVERPLDECGDGLRDVLGLLLHLEIFPEHDLFIDDPGIRLHPGAQRRLLVILTEEAANRAVWIATHDSVFVSAQSAVARYAVSRTNGITKVSVIDDRDQARDAARDLGWLPTDVFVADTLLCCEGPSDKIVFENRVRLDRHARYAGVVVAKLGGVDKVWGRQRADALRLADVARACVAHGKVVALVDRDKHSQGEIDTLAGALAGRGIGVHVLEKPELEDYWLLNSVLAHAVIAGLASEAEAKRGIVVPAPTVSEIETRLRERHTDEKASDTLDALCEEYRIRWSKESGARIAMSRIDEIAPEVADLIEKDLAAALDSALSRETHES